LNPFISYSDRNDFIVNRIKIIEDQIIAKPEPQVNIDASEKHDISAPRYLQTKIINGADNLIEEQFNLIAETIYKLKTRIGYPGEDWLHDDTEPLNTGLIFTSPG